MENVEINMERRSHSLRDINIQIKKATKVNMMFIVNMPNMNIIIRKNPIEVTTINVHNNKSLI